LFIDVSFGKDILSFPVQADGSGVSDNGVSITGDSSYILQKPYSGVHSYFSSITCQLIIAYALVKAATG
jgi:hypothetical protein